MFSSPWKATAFVNSYAAIPIPISSDGHLIFFSAAAVISDFFFGVSAVFACVSILSMIVAWFLRCFFSKFSRATVLFFFRAENIHKTSANMPRTNTPQTICATADGRGTFFMTIFPSTESASSFCAVALSSQVQRGQLLPHFSHISISPSPVSITREDLPHQQSHTHSEGTFPHFVQRPDSSSNLSQRQRVPSAKEPKDKANIKTGRSIAKSFFFITHLPKRPSTRRS